MIFKVITILVILIIIFISYVFYSNNKGKHKEDSTNKKNMSYYIDDEADTLYSLRKEDIEDTHIKEICIDKDINFIEDKCFVNCTNLANIKVEEENKNFCSKLGVLFTKDMKKIICYPPLKSTSTYFIPQGVESINTHAFINNNAIKYVIIPTSLEYIGENSFVNCKYLNQIVIPENIKEIHPRAFNLCPRLTIRCYKDSVADEYCKKYYIPCEYLTT